MSNVEAIKKALEGVDLRNIDQNTNERVWLGCANEDGEHASWFDPDEGGTPYIRADLVSTTLEALQRENETLRQALKPFSDHAGGLFQINFNRNDEVSAVETKDCFIFSIKAGAFFDARTALASAGEHHAK